MKNVIIIIALLLIPSIFIKSIYEVDYYVEERAEMQNFSTSDYFSRTSFSFQQYGAQNEYIGKNGDCYILVGLSNRDGNSDAVFEATHQNEGSKILYLYNGVVSSRPSYFQAQLDHYSEMLGVAIGRRPDVHLMLHIAAQQGCSAESFTPLTLNGVIF